MLLFSGIIIGLLIGCLILLIEIRLIKVNSTITDRIAKQLEKLKPKAPVEIIRPSTPFEDRYNKLINKEDVKLEDLYPENTEDNS